MNIDRLMLILPIDQVVRQLRYDDIIGIGSFVHEVLDGVLPSFLISKNTYVGADLVAWHYGIRDLASIARPVIGFTASSIAALGWAGVVILPLLILYPVLTFMDNICGPLKGNAWCLLFLGVSSQLAEKEIDAVLVLFVREYLIVFIVSMMMIYLYNAIYRRR